LFGPAWTYVEGGLSSAYCVSGSSNCACDVSAGFTNVPGTVTNNQWVCVRHVSASIPNAINESTLHVGGGAAAYRVATGRLLSYCNLDVDGDHTVDAKTDGLLLLRAMFGMTGTAVTNNAVGQGASRGSWASIRAHLNGNCGSTFAQ
jgi:hypothetical protein